MHAAPTRPVVPVFIPRVSLMLVSLLLFLAISAPAAFPSGSQRNLPQPGFRSLGVWDPQTSFRMDIAVWYPTTRAARDLNLEGWTLHAGREGTAVPGKYPVILVSHDAAASRLASHDLAAHLSRHGFMVIAPTHPGDNADDTSLFFRAENFAARPRHLIAAFDEVRKSPVLGPLMDTGRVGLLGVGAGAATALQLAGAPPDLSRLDRYCPDSLLLDPLCSAWSRTFHPRMKQEFTHLAGRYGPEAFTPRTGRPPVPDAADAAGPDPASVEPAPPPAEPQASPSPSSEPGKTPDGARPPVLAVGLLTPGQIDLFPDDVLRGFSVPTGILAGTGDSVYPLAANAVRLRDLLPQRPVSRTLQGVNHVDLQPPCPPLYQEGFAAMCGRTGENAVEARKIRNEFFTRFFHSYLGDPAPAPPTVPNQPGPAR